jgi:aminopeptidase N
MFLKIAAFEFRYQVKNPVFWVAAGLFFLLTFGATTVDTIQIGSSSNVHVNSPYAIAQVHLIWSLFFMFVSTAFVANVVVRDDETGFGPIIRATRVSRFSYLYGRYLGAFAAAALAFLVVPLAILVGSAMPWLDPEKVGAFHAQYYLFAYAVFALPTLFLTSAGFFALATATRSMMATYVGVVAFLILYTVAQALTAKPEYMVGTAYLEPFGFGAFELAARYWTPSERNTLLPALAGPLLANRVGWSLVGFVFLALAGVLFRPSAKGVKQSKADKLRKVAQIAPRAAAEPGSRARQRFDAGAQLGQFLARVRFDFAQVFRSPAFFVLLGLGMFNAIGGLWFVNGGYGVDIYLVTRQAIQVLIGGFSFIPMIVSIYYAGELVWRESDRKTGEIIDSTPAPDWTFVVPKILAMALIFLAMLTVSVLGAMLVQVLKHWTVFEVGKYVWWYLLPLTVSITLFGMLAIFVQALVPNKFVGWGVMVALLIVQIVLGNIGLENNLYRYGAGPLGPLPQMSDMNGLGIGGIGGWWFRLYWALIALVLAVLTYALWRRGSDSRLRPRLRRLPGRIRGVTAALLAVGVIGAVGVGGFIYINTKVWNEYRTARQDEAFQADYEKALLPFENVPQPKITDVVLNVDLHPDDLYAVTSGVYVFENKTTAPIRQLHVRFDRDVKVRSLSVEGARPAKTYERFNYRILTFDTPLAPGERRRLSFQTWVGQRGFKNSRNITRIAGNGTFLNNNEIAPIIGMDRDNLLTDRSKRRKFHLPPELRMPKLEDVAARQFNLITRDADWVNSDITITTEADQTPIAPGYKIADDVHGDRRTARFKTEAPILDFFSVQSGRYAVKTENYKGVALSVYYHPEHVWNVQRMIDALKVGLDYDQANFSPYQFRQVRIQEFPAYQGSFAQSFANTIPYSEDIGFIFDSRDPAKIDMVTYVTAHELGHQWWAHQVIGARAQGVTLLDETFAQYSALMAMEKLYGPWGIKKFLKYELDGYLRNRGGEALEELPLYKVENQAYIHYRKGSLVMYRLKDELGEDVVNRALRRLLHDYAFKGAPYPTSLDFLQDLRAEAGPDPVRQQLITDLFEKITLYDLKASSATVKPLPGGKFDVAMTVQAGTTPGSTGKEYDDGKGKVIERPQFDEAVDIGLFTAEPGKPTFGAKDVVLMQRVKLKSGAQTLHFTVDRKPTFVGVDPYNKLIDRNSDDNLVAVGK